MKMILKMFGIICIILVILTVIDIVHIYTNFKPLFAVQQQCNDNCMDNVYYGLFYNTYNCAQYTVPQIKAKWTKYSCHEVSNKSFEIIDTTEVCAEALEGIYKDETYEYFLPCIKSGNISIKFEDGRTYSLKEVLNNKILTINELMDAGLEVLVYKLNNIY